LPKEVDYVKGEEIINTMFNIQMETYRLEIWTGEALVVNQLIGQLPMIAKQIFIQEFNKIARSQQPMKIKVSMADDPNHFVSLENKAWERACEENN